MKVLVCTRETQGQRKNDFCHVPEGELLKVGGSECDREDVDGACGCRRSFVGMMSNFATTTAKVIDIPKGTKARLRKLVRGNLSIGGWLSLGGKEENNEWISGEVDDIIHVASHFLTGTVVERRGNNVRERDMSREVSLVGG